MNKPQKSPTVERPRRSNTYSPPKIEKYKREVAEYNDPKTGELICKLMDVLGTIPKQIYSAMKREVKENLETASQAGLVILMEISRIIAKNTQEAIVSRDKRELKEEMEGMMSKMSEKMDNLNAKIDQQRKAEIEYREERERRREDDETVATKYLRMLDYKMDSVIKGEEKVFDRLADRTLKDYEMVTATIAKKLETIEESVKNVRIRNESKYESERDRMIEILKQNERANIEQYMEGVKRLEGKMEGIKTVIEDIKEGETKEESKGKERLQTRGGTKENSKEIGTIGIIKNSLENIRRKIEKMEVELPGNVARDVMECINTDETRDRETLATITVNRVDDVERKVVTQMEMRMGGIEGKISSLLNIPEKINSQVLVTVVNKLDSVEENLTAEVIDLDRKIGERMSERKKLERGRITEEDKDLGQILKTRISMYEESMIQEIKEVGMNVAKGQEEIIRKIEGKKDGGMTRNKTTKAHEGTAPENSTEIIMDRLENLETNIKEEIIEAREAISRNIKGKTEEISREMEKIAERETTTSTGIQRENTYAEITRNRGHRTRKTLHSILIASKNDFDMAEDIINKTKVILEPEKNGIQIERIRKVKDQRIIVSCREEREIHKLKERINKSEELEAEKVRNKNPLIIIKEIKYKMTDEEIKTAIRNQNPDIYVDEQEEDDLKIKYRRRTRNTEKCHIIAQIKPAYWKKMIEKGHLYIEMERVRVEDQTPLIQCTRCLNFGHGKKFCQDSADRCSHCGGLHLRAECPDRKAGVPPQCCNCTHAELPETEHNAFSNSCKIREKWDSLARSTTAYD